MPTQVHPGKDTEGPSEAALARPQPPQLGNAVHTPPASLHLRHELRLFQTLGLQHLRPCITVLGDEAENGLGKVFDHVFSFGLSWPVSALLPIVAELVLLPLINGAKLFLPEYFDGFGEDDNAILLYLRFGLLGAGAHLFYILILGGGILGSIVAGSAV